MSPPLSLPFARTFALFTVAVAVALPLVGCSSRVPGQGSSSSSKAKAKACTERACHSSASIHARVPEASAGKGAHAFAIEADGVRRTCQLAYVPSGAPVSATCDGEGAVELTFGPLMKMVPAPASVPGTVGVAQTPVAGEFAWDLTIQGEPSRVHVTHTLDGKPVLDRTASPTYKESRPNGDDCPPVCRQATETWS
jgi:hypothetical protein